MRIPSLHLVFFLAIHEHRVHSLVTVSPVSKIRSPGGFVSPCFRFKGSGLLATTTGESESTTEHSPVFDFSKDEDGAVEKFERIDDAIMGGISLSSMKQIPGESFVRWSGICRLDGG
jgi:hypothetical protein